MQKIESGYIAVLTYLADFMPKDLFLVRHAQAEEADFGVKDFDRLLTPDGEIMASKIGKVLSDLVHNPDAILSSSSMRTKQTTALLTEQLQFNPVQIEVLDDLYEASTRILLRVINELGAGLNKVVIVGHNPSISYLAEYVTGAEIGNVAPAGFVHLNYDGEWNEISAKNMELVNYHLPSEVG